MPTCPFNCWFLHNIAKIVSNYACSLETEFVLNRFQTNSSLQVWKLSRIAAFLAIQLNNQFDQFFWCPVFNSESVLNRRIYITTEKIAPMVKSQNFGFYHILREIKGLVIIYLSNLIGTTTIISDHTPAACTWVVLLVRGNQATFTYFLNCYICSLKLLALPLLSPNKNIGKNPKTVFFLSSVPKCTGFKSLLCWFKVPKINLKISQPQPQPPPPSGFLWILNTEH